MRRWGACLLAVVLAGCGGGGKKAVQTPPAREAPTPAHGAAPWPAPSNPMKRTRLAGLTPETHEFVFLHVHSHLDVFVNGARVTVPAGIGIAIDDPAVRLFEGPGDSVGYGGISPPCFSPCISPLHTHLTDGILHTEAKQNQFNSLGEFFTEWNVRLDGRCVGGYCRPAAPVAIYVDGKQYTGDPRQIELQQGTEIAIVIGAHRPTFPRTSRAKGRGPAFVPGRSPGGTTRLRRHPAVFAPHRPRCRLPSRTARAARTRLREPHGAR